MRLLRLQQLQDPLRLLGLLERLAADADDPASAHDFGRDILPGAVANGCGVYGFPFRDPTDSRAGYWRDVGDLDAYWAANLELIDVSPELNLYDQQWPIWTYQEQWPPAKFVFDEDDRRGVAVDSMLAGGCIVSGARVRHSLLFSDVWVNASSVIEDSLVLPNVRIGERCRLRRTIVDSGCEIPDDTVVGHDPDEDARRFEVSTGGIVLVTRRELGVMTDPSRLDPHART